MKQKTNSPLINSSIDSILPRYVFSNISLSSTSDDLNLKFNTTLIDVESKDIGVPLTQFKDVDEIFNKRSRSALVITIDENFIPD